MPPRAQPGATIRSMNALRLPLFVVCAWLAFAGGRVCAKDGVLHLEGTSAHIQAPPTSWTSKKHDSRAGQIGYTWSNKAGSAVASVLVFPLRREGKAKSLLRQAVDTAIRARVRRGFGMLDQTSFEILGRDGSDARIEIALAEGKANGVARLLRISDAQWGFAWGYATAKAPAESVAIVERIVKSLRTTDPHLFTLRFDERPTFAKPVAVIKGEEPIRREHIVAVQLLIEASRGERFPVAIRPLLRQALIDDVRESRPKWREGFREALRSVRKAERLPLTSREKNFADWGTAIFAGYMLRSSRRELAGMKVTTIWEKLSAPVAVERGQALNTCDYSSMAEMASFFASLALDTGVSVSDSIQAELKSALAGRWKALCIAAGVPVPATSKGSGSPKGKQSAGTKPGEDSPEQGPASKDPTSKGPTSKDPASKDPASKDPASKDPASKDPAPRDSTPAEKATGVNPPKDPRPVLSPEQVAAAREISGLRRADRQWARLRHSWDRATPTARLAMRKAIITHAYGGVGASATEQLKALESIATRADLKRWYEAQKGDALPKSDDVLRAMMGLTFGEREQLIDHLGVRDADYLHFGW